MLRRVCATLFAVAMVLMTGTATAWTSQGGTVYIDPLSSTLVGNHHIEAGGHFSYRKGYDSNYNSYDLNDLDHTNTSSDPPGCGNGTCSGGNDLLVKAVARSGSLPVNVTVGYWLSVNGDVYGDAHYEYFTLDVEDNWEDYPRSDVLPSLHQQGQTPAPNWEFRAGIWDGAWEDIRAEALPDTF